MLCNPELRQRYDSNGTAGLDINFMVNAHSSTIWCYDKIIPNWIHENEQNVQLRSTGCYCIHVIASTDSQKASEKGRKGTWHTSLAHQIPGRGITQAMLSSKKNIT